VAGTDLMDDELVGRVLIHCGDDSAFRATKQPRPAERPKRVVKSRSKSPKPHYH
jgi:hypothetical protein